MELWPAIESPDLNIVINDEPVCAHDKLKATSKKWLVYPTGNRNATVRLTQKYPT
jgi:hypothetical protein